MLVAVAALAAALVAGMAAPAAAAPTRAWVVKVADAAAPVGRRVSVVADDTFVVHSAVRPSGPDVLWAAPDTTYSAARVPLDPCYLSCPTSLEGQPELRAVGAPAAWDVSSGSPAVTVAVLDTVADTSHPDLTGKVRAGPDFVRERCSRPTSLARHGTAVAGIVGARTDNALGMASLGWQTSVLSVGVLDGCGVGTGSAIATGIRYAVDVGARIVNLSLSGEANPAVGDAVAYARARGVLVVAAAGNDGSSTPAFPAAYAGVLGVASTDSGATRLSSFSNWGPWLDLAAPGESILSTAPGGGYASFDGTSFAAPLVSAAAALVLARHPAWDGDDVTVRLVRSARAAPAAGLPVLDAGSAVTERPGGAWLASADGGVFAFGDAAFAGRARPARPVVGLARAGADRGSYWLVASDGGVFSFGRATFFGSTGAMRLNRPIVGMAPTPSARGYWLVASDGGVFTFGDAGYFGSTGAMRLNKPIVGMAPTPSGRGYWLVASDGGIFSFGDAGFAGSTGGIRLVSPVVGMAAVPSGPGYWLVAADGGVFAFGGAPFLGSAAGSGRVTIGMAAGPGGYWLGSADGRLVPFGSVPDDGSLHPPPPSPIVGVASTA